MRAFNAILKGGINTKLVRVFILQILAISAATVMGVYAAAVVVERVLVHEALRAEAAHYWTLRQDNPYQSLPDTNHLVGYLALDGDFTRVPESLHSLSQGIHRVRMDQESNPIVHVSEQGSARLFMVFDEVQLSQLAFYFGIAPLTGVLLMIYLLTWFGYLMSRRAVSTVVGLADAVRRIDFRAGQVDTSYVREYADTNDPEVLALVNAFEQFGHRLESFVQRERNFTRSASHELRTPLAVLKANLELVKRYSDEARRAEVMERMARTVRDMEALVETLLILARESESKLSWTSVVMNDLLPELVDQVKRAVPCEQVEVRVQGDNLLEVKAPERVLAIVFNNLLANALTFTESGSVTVTIRGRVVSVRDTGLGMTEDDLERAFEPFYRGHDRGGEGYGLGLAIVKRLCKRFGWRLEADSELGVGTEVSVEFPESRVQHFSGKKALRLDEEPPA